MAESAALLVDDVLQGYPIRQWVLSLPIPLRLLLARYPSELSKVMLIRLPVSFIKPSRHTLSIGPDFPRNTQRLGR